MTPRQHYEILSALVSCILRTSEPSVSKRGSMNSRRTWVSLYLPCLKETLYACVAILVVFSCNILFSEGVPLIVFAIMGML